MTDYKIVNTVIRTTIALILIGASITTPLTAAATENSFLSAEFHAAAMEASDRLKDDFRVELAENIRPPTARRINLVLANGQMDDVVQEDQLMSSDATSVTRGDDT